MSAIDSTAAILRDTLYPGKYLIRAGDAEARASRIIRNLTLDEFDELRDLLDRQLHDANAEVSARSALYDAVSRLAKFPTSAGAGTEKP